jgi:glycosyltransferase involved in cell wall biosynthesis
MPQFSVLMSVYNHEAYVAQAIGSVLAQTVDDWELILINDGSTDGSGKILDEFAAQDARLRVLHQPNGGLANARNVATRLARADWITYLDSDDIWFPEALERHRDYLRQHPQGRFLYGYCHRLLVDGTVVPLKGEFQEQPTGAAELFGRVFLCPLCVCHHRDLWELAGGFDRSLRYCDDYDFFLRVALHCRFEPLGLPLGLRRRHGSNMSKQTGRSQKTEAEVLQRFFETCGAAAGVPAAAAHERLARIYYRASRQFLKEGDYRQALEMVGHSRRYQPSWKAALVGLAGRVLLPFGQGSASARAS